MISCQDSLFQVGKPNKIQCSRETAEHLTKLGKGAWVSERTDISNMQVSGIRELYWETVPSERAGSTCSASIGAGSTEHPILPSNPSLKLRAGHDDRMKRLIDWNVEMLSQLMKEIGARRANIPKSRRESMKTVSTKTIPLDEVREIIHLPEFDSHNASKHLSPEDVALPLEVTKQLHHLVSAIASMYNENPCTYAILWLGLVAVMSANLKMSDVSIFCLQSITLTTQAM